ncbi:hypothetical protein [Rubinisphaera sp.]|uniref:hypothetical protein n=1 Tax=Rubinisphaera sp. TaxID=2024857 RepID=UPI000C11B7A7|nr:hypothetical protein [Rubinisphaera sp.]MBV11524.1 hypothetical protein [Rubinisphaera sp.]HCS52955.1 hypothetical protein [Planctomycetaceae bacterium]|tara:strand:- start:248 stop:541 length:294 start_codon:yes stop_codon:yes gene_type:complete
MQEHDNQTEYSSNNEETDAPKIEFWGQNVLLKLSAILYGTGILDTLLLELDTFPIGGFFAGLYCLLVSLLGIKLKFGYTIPILLLLLPIIGLLTAVG